MNADRLHSSVMNEPLHLLNRFGGVRRSCSVMPCRSRDRSAAGTATAYLWVLLIGVGGRVVVVARDRLYADQHVRPPPRYVAQGPPSARVGRLGQGVKSLICLATYSRRGCRRRKHSERLRWSAS